MAAGQLAPVDYFQCLREGRLPKYSGLRNSSPALDWGQADEKCRAPVAEPDPRPWDVRPETDKSLTGGSSPPYLASCGGGGYRDASASGKEGCNIFTEFRGHSPLPAPEGSNDSFISQRSLNDTCASSSNLSSLPHHQDPAPYLQHSQSLDKDCPLNRSITSINSERSSRLDPHTYQSYAAGILYSSRRSDKFLRLQNNFALLERISELGEHTRHWKRSGRKVDQQADRPQEQTDLTDSYSDRHDCDEIQELYSELNEAQRNREFFYTATRMDSDWDRWAPTKEKGLEMSAGVGERTNWYHQALSLAGPQHRSSSPSSKPSLVGSAMPRGKSFSDLYNVYDGTSVHLAKNSAGAVESLKEPIKPLDRSLPLRQSYIQIMDKATRNKRLRPIYGTHIGSRENSYDKHITANVKKLRQAFDKDQPALKASASSPDISRSSSIMWRPERECRKEGIPETSTSFSVDRNSCDVSQSEVSPEHHTSDPEIFVASSLETLPSYSEVGRRPPESDGLSDKQTREDFSDSFKRKSLDSEQGADGESILPSERLRSTRSEIQPPSEQPRSYQSDSNSTDTTAVEVAEVGVQDGPEEDSRVLHVRASSAPHQGTPLSLAPEMAPLYRTNSSRDTFFGADLGELGEQSGDGDRTNFEVVVPENSTEPRTNSLHVISKHPQPDEENDQRRVYRAEKDNTRSVDLSQFLSRTHSKDIYTKHVESAPSRKSSYSEPSHNKSDAHALSNQPTRLTNTSTGYDVTTPETRPRLLSDHSDIRSRESSPTKEDTRPDAGLSKYEQLLAKARKERMARKGYLHSYVNDPDSQHFQMYTAITDIDLRFKNAYPSELDSNHAFTATKFNETHTQAADPFSPNVSSRKPDISVLEDPFSPSPTHKSENSLIKDNFPTTSLENGHDTDKPDGSDLWRSLGNVPPAHDQSSQPVYSVSSRMATRAPETHGSSFCFDKLVPVSTEVPTAFDQDKHRLQGDRTAPDFETTALRHGGIHTHSKVREPVALQRPAYLLKQEGRRETSGQPAPASGVTQAARSGNMPDVVQIDLRDGNMAPSFSSEKQEKEGPTVYHDHVIAQRTTPFDVPAVDTSDGNDHQATQKSAFKVADLRCLAKNSEIPVRTFPRMNVPQSITASDFSNQVTRSHIESSGVSFSERLPMTQPRPFPRKNYTAQKYPSRHQQGREYRNDNGLTSGDYNLHDLNPLNSRLEGSSWRSERQSEESSPSPTNSSDGSTGTFIVNHGEPGLGDSTSSLGQYYTSPTIQTADRAFTLPIDNISSSQSHFGSRPKEIGPSDHRVEGRSNSRSLPRNFSVGTDPQARAGGKQSVQHLKNMFEQRAQNPSPSPLSRAKSVPNLTKDDSSSKVGSRSLPRSSTVGENTQSQSPSWGRERNDLTHRAHKNSPYERTRDIRLAHSSTLVTASGKPSPLYSTASRTEPARRGINSEYTAPVPTTAAPRGRYDPYIPPNDIYREVEGARLGRKLDVPRKKPHSPSTAGKLTMEYFDMLGSEWQQSGRSRNSSERDQSTGSTPESGQRYRSLLNNSETDDMKLEGQGRVWNPKDGQQTSSRNVSHDQRSGKDSGNFQNVSNSSSLEKHQTPSNSQSKPQPPPLYPRSRFLSSVSRDSSSSCQSPPGRSGHQPTGSSFTGPRDLSQGAPSQSAGYTKSRPGEAWAGPNVETSKSIAEKVPGKTNLVSAWVHHQGKHLL